MEDNLYVAVSEKIDELSARGPAAQAAAEILPREIEAVEPMDMLALMSGLIAELRTGVEGLGLFPEKRKSRWRERP